MTIMLAQVLEARANARHVAVAALCGGGIVSMVISESQANGVVIRAIQITALLLLSMVPLFLAIEAALVRRLGMSVGDSRKASCEAFLGLFSFAVCAYYLLLAYGVAFEVFESLNRVTLASFSEGRIPSAFFLFLTAPLAITPAGFNRTFAKVLTLANFTFFAAMLVVVYFKAVRDCEGVCTTEELNDRLLNLANDANTGVVMTIIAYCTSLPGAEIGDKFIVSLYAKMEADSILNHVIKNSIAGAASLVELEQQHQLTQQQEQQELNSLSPPSRPSQHLQQAVAQIYRTMHWCANRQCMIDLAEGTYKSSISRVSVATFLEDVASTQTSVKPLISDLTSDFIQQGTFDVAFDRKMARLSLENGVTNALVHGDGKAIKLNAVLKLDNSASLDNEWTASGWIVFTVKNGLQVSDTVTPNSFKHATSKQTTTSSTASQVSLSFINNYFWATISSKPWSTAKTKDREGATRLAVPNIKKSSSSTSCGLKHIGMACRGAGGSFDLSLTKESGVRTVVFTLTLPVVLLPARREVSSLKSVSSTNNFAQLMRRPSSALNVCAIDDSTLICKAYSKLLLPLLDADNKHSVVICPQTQVDVDFFLDRVVGDHIGHESANICLLDQNIEISDEIGGQKLVVLGTDLARKLRFRGFPGLVVVRSGNDSESEQRDFMKDGSVDMCLGKSESTKDIAIVIRKKWRQGG